MPMTGLVRSMSSKPEALNQARRVRPHWRGSSRPRVLRAKESVMAAFYREWESPRKFSPVRRPVPGDNARNARIALGRCNMAQGRLAGLVAVVLFAVVGGPLPAARAQELTEPDPKQQEA